METCGFKLPLQRSGAEPALCGSRSRDDLRQLAVPLGMGLFQSFDLCSIRWDPPVQAVQAVQSLRSVQIVKRRTGLTVQTFKDRFGRRTSTFREFSKCRMAAMVNFFRSVKLVRDLGNLSKLGTRERLIIERAITPSVLCPLAVPNGFRPGISWQQRSG